jgi:cell division protein FtsL
VNVLTHRPWPKISGSNDRLGRRSSVINWWAVNRFCLLAAILFVTVFFMIWQNVQIIRGGYEIGRLKGRLAELQKENNLLVVEASTLEDLATMEQRAVAELGMMKPAPGQVIYFNVLPPMATDDPSPRQPAPRQP